jgi:hypothetical protein
MKESCVQFFKVGPWEWEYDRKNPGWSENSGRRNRKTAGKKSGLVEIFSQGERKRLPVHETCSTATSFVYRPGFPSPFVSV